MPVAVGDQNPERLHHRLHPKPQGSKAYANEMKWDWQLSD
jgi:hypothetical protein